MRRREGGGMRLASGLGLLLLIGMPSAATPVPTDDLTCFCLRHPSGSVLTGCRARLASPHDTMPRATCRDDETGQNRASFTVDNIWTVIEAGQDRCTPCDNRPPRRTFDPPRLPEQEQK
jgi:hypothetical protein